MIQKQVQLGRPTKFTEELAAEICMRLRMGETLVDICKDKHMPARQRVYDWQEQYPAFRDAYARAREEQMHAWADEIITLADDAKSDWKIVLDTKEGDVAQFDATHVRRAELQIRTRQWLMERIVPALYGARQVLDVHHRYEEMDDAELLAELRQAIQEAGIEPSELVASDGSTVH